MRSLLDSIFGGPGAPGGTAGRYVAFLVTGLVAALQWMGIIVWANATGLAEPAVAAGRFYATTRLDGQAGQIDVVSRCIYARRLDIQPLGDGIDVCLVGNIQVSRWRCGHLASCGV